MTIIYILGFGLGGILIITVLWYTDLYNRLIVQEERVHNAMAQIGVQLESRWDALESLMQATSMYQENEGQVLLNVIEKRQGVNRNSTVNEVEMDEARFNDAVHSINMVAEQYPELKASELYQTTMKSIVDYEEKVKYARMIFNDSVTKYNRLGKVFPNVLVAEYLGYKEKEYFVVSENKRGMPTW